MLRCELPALCAGWVRAQWMSPLVQAASPFLAARISWSRRLVVLSAR